MNRARRVLPWAELAVTTSASFLRGASHPEEHVARAAELGHEGIGIADMATVGGSVRAHVACMQAASQGRAPIRLAHGARVTLSIVQDSEVREVAGGSTAGSAAFPRASADHRGIELLLYATDRPSWGALCLLLTQMRSSAAASDMRRCSMDAEDGSAPGRPTASLDGELAWHRETGASFHDLAEILAAHPGGRSLQAVIVPPWLPTQRFLEAAEGLARLMPDRLAVALRRTEDPEGVVAAERACVLAGALGVPVAAMGDARMHDIARRPLLDVLCAIRHGKCVQRMGPLLARNAERRLRRADEMRLRFADRPDAVETAWRFIERASAFSLAQLRYEYPDEVAPRGVPPMQHLHDLVWKGARERYPRGVPAKVARQFEHEFAIIGDLGYAPYFLTVHDIVAFARSRGILCQGRGAAANSAVCFALGITAVDPDRIDVLFERFVSRERNEPPDIDIDFEHERREEVIQHIYARYGRHRAALVSEIICYRGRSAVRDAGKALGLAEDAVSKLAAGVDRWSGGGIAAREEGGLSGGSDVAEISTEAAARMREAGIDPGSPTARHFVRLVAELQGFPRHRSQHVGGFVISRGPLAETVPIENAAMQDRTVLEWDKDDIEALGMLKIDILALGMLTAIRKAIDLVNGDRHALACGAPEGGAPDAPRPRADLRPVSAGHGDGTEGTATADDRDSGAQFPAQAVIPAVSHAAAPLHDPLRFHSIPAEDPQTYDMICKADTVGVFQIESRAQMSMLPRLRPRVFYDLVIEVAIVRPGPIQGDMVHPYLRRRSGEEPAEYPDEAVRKVLGKTLGVPLFQEQAMALAVVAAGFTPGEADHLRRAIAAWKRSGNQIAQFGERLEAGMLARGYSRHFAQQVFEQIKGFSGYGFPESHAASFALLVYASAWLKRHHPAAFAAALLNSQPMGFYAPAQVVRDAREHGVAVRAVDVHCSLWDTTLERGPDPAVSSEGAVGAVRIDAGLDAMIDAARRGTCAEGAYSVEMHATMPAHDALRVLPGPLAPVRPAMRWRRWFCPAGTIEEQGVVALHGYAGQAVVAPPPLSPRHSQGRSVAPSLLAPGSRPAPNPDTTMPPQPQGRRQDAGASGPPPDWMHGCSSGVAAAQGQRAGDGSFQVRAQPALRLGMRMVRGLHAEEAQRIVEAVRREGRFARIRDLQEAAGVAHSTLRRLAAADAFASMGLDRQQASWQILALRDAGPTLWSFGMQAPPAASGRVGADCGSVHASPMAPAEDPRAVRPPSEGQGVFFDDLEPNLPLVAELSAITKDFEATGVSLKRHPIACIRPALERKGVLPCSFLRDEPAERAAVKIAVAGIVLVRQRPSTAKGVVFMTIEDESGIANLIFRPKVYERLRGAVRHAVAICAHGRVERRQGVVHLLVTDARDIGGALVEEGRSIAAVRQFH